MCEVHRTHTLASPPTPLRRLTVTKLRALTQAQMYRARFVKNVRQKGVRCPRILTMDGGSVDSTSFVDPSARQAAPPSIYFGAAKGGKAGEEMDLRDMVRTSCARYRVIGH